MTAAADGATLIVQAAVASDVGCVREHNEDVVLAGDLDGDRFRTRVTAPVGPHGVLLAVCDGMGGVEGGEVAAAMAADVLWRELRLAHIGADPEVAARLLRRAVRAANQAIWGKGREIAELRGMGTTLSAAIAVGHALIVAQVGDSRVYVLRRGVLTQVTRDQSLLSAMQGAGMLDGGRRPSPLAANAILQALGVTPDAEPSLSIIALRAGDRILVCSDGLHGLVPGERIGDALAVDETLPRIAASLVTAARTAGGADNISVALLQVEAGPPAPRDDDDQPVFREFDPHEQGDAALSTTSTVVRRLASRVGIGRDPGRRIPSTGQHATIPDVIDDLAPTAPAADVVGPASARVAVRPRPWLPWALAAVIIAVAAALLATR